MHAPRSVQPEWCTSLPMQQQSVLFLAARGPDGIAKYHPCKDVVRAYRATVLMAAHSGRMLTFDDKGDTFMSLRVFGVIEEWDCAVDHFFETVDELPHHYYMHLMHGAEIIGYKHPDRQMRDPWFYFYLRCCRDLHLTPETWTQMDVRLSDGNQADWS